MARSSQCSPRKQGVGIDFEILYMKTLKEWRFEIAAKLGIKPESVYMRLRRGLHPEVKGIKENHQRQFVKEKKH